MRGNAREVGNFFGRNDYVVIRYVITIRSRPTYKDFAGTTTNHLSAYILNSRASFKRIRLREACIRANRISIAIRTTCTKVIDINDIVILIANYGASLRNIRTGSIPTISTHVRTIAV